MSRIKGALAIAALTISGIAAAHDQTAEFRAMLKAGEPRMKKAFESKDINWFKNASTADFTYKAFGQPVTNKAQSLAGMQQMFGMMDKIEVHFKLISATAKDNVGKVSFQSTFTGWTKPSPQDKKSHKMVMKSWENETWVKKNGKWLIKGIVEPKAGVMTMDGKPFDPSKMGGG